MDKNGARQQLVEKIKDSANVLVTVGVDPTVDELAAALGVTLLLNKLEKHATAVVSGAIPPAITFLDPEKTFENTVDSLRDFIIALDKEKADHLRYKIDGDVVKIFITPYKTTIAESDLQFSQGDYNVELVIGVGVTSKDHLDKALAAHGRILHDATVTTVTAGEKTSTLGSIDWHDDNASSVSEMLVSIVESLKGEEPLLDEQIATAFLTGIVAATDRFSNTRTSSKVMTMAAQLMAAGANQQLIASKLAEAHEIDSTEPETPTETPDTTPPTDPGQKKPKSKKKKDPGYLKLDHEETEKAPEIVAADEPNDVALSVDAAEQAKETTVENNQAQAAKEAEEALAKELESVKAATPAPEAPALQGAVDASVWKAASATNADEPSLGGTLNATTAQAEADNEKALEDDRNKTILSHGPLLQGEPTYNQSVNDAPAEPEVSAFDPGAATEAPATGDHEQTLAELDAAHRAAASKDDHESAARDQVNSALEAAPFSPNFQPQANIGAQSLPPVDQSQLSAPAAPPVAGMPLPPPLPDFSSLPPLPPAPAPFPEVPQQAPLEAPVAPVQPPVAPEVPSAPADPGQFKIPGQR